MPLSTNYISLAVGAALVVFGLLVYGFRDLRTFSLYRMWAVSGVVFRESVRRKVLWVTPLAMIATVLLVQLQDPADEPDAIRQAIKFCLFASGLVVVVVSLILASTNLPREIDSRVIFTIVTKPLTRMELLVGKIVGFARLSALVLLLMGIFSAALLIFLDWQLTGRIATRLEGPLPQESRRPYLEHLAEDGLLHAAHVDSGDDIQVYAIEPTYASEADAEPRFFYPTDYYAAVPFRIPPEVLAEIETLEDPRLAVRLRLAWQMIEGRLLPGDPPLGIVNLETLPPAPPPLVEAQVMDADLYNVIAPSLIEDNPVELPVEPSVDWAGTPAVVLGSQQTAHTLEEADGGLFYIAVYGVSPQYLYGIAPDSLQLEVRNGPDQVVATFDAYTEDRPRANIVVRTILGSYGIGLNGPEEDLPAPVGIVAFRDTPAPQPDAEGRVGFELNLGVERTGGLLDEGNETRVEARVVNIQSDYASEPQVLYPETGQPVFFSVPAEAVAGGDFDLRLQTLSRGHVVGVRGSGVRLVIDEQPFVLNLAKGLLVQWLLSLLVIAAALAFSTFVSWPIAVVLTLVLLLGRWVAEQLGGALEGGMGRRVAQDLFGAGGDVAAREAVRASVDALTQIFTTVTSFLPNVTVYNMADSVERGLALDWGPVGQATLVTLAFALPLTALAYIALRNKEVAP